VSDGPRRLRSATPTDRTVLRQLRDRLLTTRQVATARLIDGAGHLELLVTLSEDYYPTAEATSTLTVRWYTNDDFSVHYQEETADGNWECRWDRHPNPHDTREHFHPPPDAETPGADRSWPKGYRDLLRHVLNDIEGRIEQLWAE